MSTSKHKRKLILLYLNLVVTAATLVSFSYTTMAWFVHRRTAAIILQSVTVAVPEFVITDYKTYGVKTLTKNASTTDVTFANDVVHSLPMYDPLSFAYNKYKKAVVVHITYTYTGTATNNFSATTFYPTFTTGTPGAGANDLNYTSNCL